MKRFKEYIKESVKENIEESSANLAEASVARLNQHLERGDVVAIVSACRSDRPDSKNKALTNDLRRRVLGMHFGYNKAVGGYTETLENGKQSDKVEETSTVIYASPDRKKELFKLAFDLGVDYDQECILFVNENKDAEWVFTNPSKESGYSRGDRIKLGTFHPVQIGQYFTKIGKRSFSFTVESEEYNSFSDTNGEIKLLGVAEAAMYECLRRDLKRKASLLDI